MTEDDQPRFGMPQTFTELLEAEEAQVKAGAPGCWHTCPGCHGGPTCLRLAHGDDRQHAGRDSNGDWVQWIGPCDDESARAAAEFLDGAAR